MPISPPTVGFSFGSFGDIITVLQLAWALRAALDESAGASAELRALVRDVDSFTRALQDVQANIERSRKTLRPDVVNGIAVALSRCRNVLSAIQQRIERARGRTSTSGWHKYWGAAAWSILGGKKDVEALRARLSEQLGVMQLYLSLSDANSQDCVQDALAAHGTTLQRIYTVIQDIQLRFDVGVPGFQFYDRDTHQYYPPLARTSLQRIWDVSKAFMPPDSKEMCPFLIKHHGITGKDFNNLSVISTQATLLINLSDRHRPVQGHVEAYFFREAAFGEWQALVGRANFDSHMDVVLKTLLERNHTVGADCNCPVACSTVYRDEVDGLVWRSKAAKAYAEVLSLVFEHLQPAEFELGWLSSLVDPFRQWPDPEHLRLTVPTVLSRRHFSLDDMVGLISNAPSYRGPAHPMRHFWNKHTIGFSVEGAALSESLVGHALPIPAGLLSHYARLPDWAYISNDYSDGGRNRGLGLAMNLNKECRCGECR